MARPERQRQRSRRQFLKNSGMGLLGASLSENVIWAWEESAPQPTVDPGAVVTALGDTLIPTVEPEYPGYRRFEPQKISALVWNNMRFLERVSEAELRVFNGAAQTALGKSFVDLDADGRSKFFELITRESERLEPQHAEAVAKVFQAGRRQVFTVFYKNFPFHAVERDERGAPILTDEEHQVINPKKGNQRTGWEIADFRGPLSWKEEEEARTRIMKIHWHKESAPRV